MWIDRRNKNCHDPSRHSLAAEPLCGLLAIGLAVILIELTAAVISELFPENNTRKIETGRCAYQVFEDDLCVGTVFYEAPQSLGAILAALGRDAGANRYGNEEKIPCDRTIRLFSHSSTKTVSKISGAHLLVMGKSIDLNLADQSDLDAIPGIGPELARRIVTYRETHGPFKQVVDLERVRGIGKKRIDILEGYLTSGASQ